MIEVSVEAVAFKAIVARLRQESDGKALRKELVTNLKAAAEPVKADISRAVQATPSKGHKGASLRASIARSVMIQVRTGGALVGVRLTTRKGGFPRGFARAPVRYDSPKGWRHPVWGHRDRWAHNEGHPFWTEAASRHSDEARAACGKAMADVLKRIAGIG